MPDELEKSKVSLRCQWVLNFQCIATWRGQGPSRAGGRDLVVGSELYWAMSMRELAESDSPATRDESAVGTIW